MSARTVDILLATRNGSRFVKEQILSLLGQTFRDFRILVHDDGSDDRTVDIVRELASRDSRITLLDDGVRVGSASKNFMHLLRHSDAPWIMFCDQDDVWYEDKIEKMMKKAAGLPEGSPGVVYSRANYWNQEKGILGQTWRRYPIGLQQFLTQKAAVQGSAALFNSAAREIMLSYDGHIVMHDHLLALVTYTFGNVETMQDVLMNYRQHDSNVTGNNDETKGWLTWLKAKVVDRRPVMGWSTQSAVKGFYRVFNDRMPEDRKKIFEEFFRLEHMSRIGRSVSALRNGFTRDGSVVKLMLKFLVADYLPKRRD